MGSRSDCDETHLGNDRWRALRSHIAAQGFIHAPVLPTAPHTPVGRVSSQTQAAVTAAKGAVVEHHCGGERVISGRSVPSPTFPRLHLPCSLLSMFLPKDLTYR